VPRSSLPRQLRNGSSAPSGGSTVAVRRPTTVAPATPAPIRQSLNQHGMNTTGSFGPGAPMNPYFGYSQRTRAMDYPVGVNISTRSRASWGKVSYDVLKALIDAYDVARMCINHKIDEIRSMELMFQPADGVKDDVDEAIDVAKLVLAYPDRELPYESWVSKWLENALKYDSAPLYRRRDYDGNIIALEVVDGKTINPYIDENGRRPKAPAPAYWQTVHGMVADWLTTDDIIYVPFRPQEDSPFGLAPIESILLTANTDIRFQWHFLQMFTEGSVPAGFIKVPPDVSSPDQVAEWQDYWDAMVMGDQAKMRQLIAVPADSDYIATKPATFDKAFPEYLMIRTCAAFGVVSQDLSLTGDVNRATGETQTDIQFRVNTLPWVRYVEGILTRYLQHDIGLPVKVRLDTGREVEDRLQEAQANKLYVDMGALSSDEVRVDVLGKPIDKERPTPRFYSTARLGPIPLLSIESVAGKTDPETFGPDRSQKALDQPFVPAIGVIPHPGTTDDKASLAATDAAQVAARQQLDASENPNRESQPTPDATAAPAAPAAPAAAPSPAQQDDQEDDEKDVSKGVSWQVVKGDTVVTHRRGWQYQGDRDRAQEGELAAFRVFVKGASRRGAWDRDFAFTTVPQAVAAELNRGGRAEVAQVVKAKADATAQAVYEQLADNFPAEAIGWVKGLRWTGPVSVPLENIDFSDQDTWAASSEPGRVDKTVRKIRAGKPVKPAVLIERPGESALMVADGHHRAEGAQRAGVPLRAYIAHPDKAVGPWDEMHSSQQVNKAGAVPGLTKRSGMISLDLEPGTIPVTPGGLADHHITIVYLGPDVDDDAFAQAVARAGAAAAAIPGPVSGTVHGVDTFTPSAGSDGKTPAFARVELPAAHDLNGMLADLSASEHRVYHPHVTLKYLDDGEQTPEPVTPTPVTFTHLAVHRGDQVTRIPLGPQGGQGTAGGLPVCPCCSGAGAHADGPCECCEGSGADTGDVGACTCHDGMAKAADDPKGRAPQGPDNVQQWPGWARDQELARIYAERLRTALTARIDTADYAARWLALNPVRKAAGDDEAANDNVDEGLATARAWLEHQGVRQQLVDAFRAVLTNAYTEAYVLGDRSAQAMVNGAAPDWGAWTPGDPDAANLVLGFDGLGAGLQQMLAAQGIQQIKSLGAGRFDDLAQAIALSLENGDSVDTLARDLRDILDNGSRAQMVAVTELARAVSQASLDTYRRNGLPGKEWLIASSGACAICEDNADAGVIPLDDAFPSGDDGPPGHPRCRCAPGPGFVIGGSDG